MASAREKKKTKADELYLLSPWHGEVKATTTRRRTSYD